MGQFFWHSYTFGDSKKEENKSGGKNKSNYTEEKQCIKRNIWLSQVLKTSFPINEGNGQRAVQ